MDAWLVWLLLAVALGVAEIFTLTAALGLLGGAALITAGLAALGVPLPVQLVVFALASAASVLLVRPVAARHMVGPQTQRFGVDALIGKSAYTVREVTAWDGRIRLDGEEWTAHSFDETVVIPEGTTVDVLQISGSTAIVYPRE
ncbi:membrane protein implicated in regulation of membrane protease activity [Saccharopolyspora erythraea NRRL 2338]|uniref:Integral membrane protein n=2 Tax=Saccharopolyspora erythraea TaxID=1836 RepID=A4FCL2_SACEN|nr:NfeD family protein [Saccharopolyspora erythraea]EQD87412.1 membrane protein [Saccharopolyspora erythraea D]PFG95550.1 membrane protein implicated in regulation of membrane protease activity [Saccharopolyspora erythraea NRRL 2338]QRK92169.1 NfeD family protein [Saccharopolyspora erythraea]CAM01787.1 integral membrane protein [Saccharopolyspora erythraea NRRL 2338]